MSLGPIELLAVKFPGSRFTVEIIDALNELVDQGTVRIVDFVFASKNDRGELRVLELAELDGESLAALEPLVEEVLGILSEEDVARMGAVLPNGASAGLMLFENVWETRFREAIGRARGELFISEPIAPAVVEQVLAAQYREYTLSLSSASLVTS